MKLLLQWVLMIIETAARRPVAPFVGGRLCLDFANTVHGRRSETPRDELTTYEDVVIWARSWGAITASEARLLLESGARDKSAADRALRRAKKLRDALYLILTAAVHGREAPELQLATLRKEIAVALQHQVIVPGRTAWQWAWSEAFSLERLLWPIALSAASLLTSAELTRVRKCAEGPCTWLFLDTSRGRHRRWCDMRKCGNRAKFRRFYAQRSLGAQS